MLFQNEPHSVDELFFFAPKYNVEDLFVFRQLDDYEGIKAYFLIRKNEFSKAEEIIIIKKEIREKDIYSKLAKALLFLDEEVVKQELAQLATVTNNIWILYELASLVKDHNSDLYSKTMEELRLIQSPYNMYYVLKAYEKHAYEDCQAIINFLSFYPELGDQEAVSYKAEALYNCGKIEEAKKEYERSLSLAENAFAYHGLGSIYLFDFVQVEKAREMFEKAWALDKNFYEALVGLAWTDFYLGFGGTANARFIEALEKSDLSQYALEEYALFQIYLDNYDVAEEYLDLSVNTYGVTPNNEGFQILLNIEKGLLSSEEISDVVDSFRNRFGPKNTAWLINLIRD